MQCREEVAGIRWSEIDVNRKLWRIPAERMKNSRPHDVHLSDAALGVLAGIPRQNEVDLVFTTNGKTAISGFSRAKLGLDAASPCGAAASCSSARRLHDLRRTGVTKLARDGLRFDRCRQAAGPQAAKLRGVASVYQRHDFAKERARALDAWGARRDRRAFEPKRQVFCSGGLRNAGPHQEEIAYGLRRPAQTSPGSRCSPLPGAGCSQLCFAGKWPGNHAITVGNEPGQRTRKRSVGISLILLPAKDSLADEFAG